MIAKLKDLVNDYYGVVMVFFLIIIIDLGG